MLPTKYSPDVQKKIEAINQQMNAHRSMANSLSSLKHAIIQGNDFDINFHSDIYAHELKDMIMPHVEKALEERQGQNITASVPGLYGSKEAFEEEQAARVITEDDLMMVQIYEGFPYHHNNH